MAAISGVSRPCGSLSGSPARLRVICMGAKHHACVRVFCMGRCLMQTACRRCGCHAALDRRLDKGKALTALYHVRRHGAGMKRGSNVYRGSMSQWHNKHTHRSVHAAALSTSKDGACNSTHPWAVLCHLVPSSLPHGCDCCFPLAQILLSCQ